MITILTYHDVRPQGPLPKDDHYTISADLLQSHLETFRKSGMVAPQPESLQHPSRLGSASFFLAFDDGDALHATLTAPLLESRGLRGIFFVPTQRLDRTGFLTTENVQAMSRAGHVFGLHGHFHRRLDLLPEAELVEDFSLSREILQRATGSPPWVFAPVGGYGSHRVDQAACHCGIRVIRTMRWGLNHKPNPLSLETIPVNRDFGARQLERVLFKGSFGRGYLAKEFFKRILPEFWYNRIRQSLPRMTKGFSLPSRHE